MNARRFLALLLILSVGYCGCGRVEHASLCILHTNDIHGHVLPERVAGWEKEMGGAAVLAGCIKNIREKNEGEGIATLLLDAGDIYVGTPEGNISKGSALIEVMNAMGYDAMAVGNHDLDGGVANLMALAESADFPFIGANVVDSQTGMTARFLQPYIVKVLGRLKVGVIGVTIPGMTPMDLPGERGQIVFQEYEEHIRDALENLEDEGADFTVLVSHLGTWPDKRIARDIEGIDVIIGGHQHAILREPLRSPESGTLICQSGSYGKYLGKLDLEIDPQSGKVLKYDYELIPLTEGRCAPDPSVGAIVKKWESAAGHQFDEVIGSSESDFLKDSEGVARLGEMIADGMREATGAQIAFNQRHGIRAPLLKGTIRYRDVYKILPFDDTLWTVTLTGEQIGEIMEKVLSFRRPDNLRFSGLEVVYDPAAPRGRKIVLARCGREELVDDESYRVAVNTYLARWGFINTLVARGRDLSDRGILIRDVFSDYIRAHSPLSAGGVRSSRLVARENTAAGFLSPVSR